MIVSFYIALLRKTFFIPNKFDRPLGGKIGIRNFSFVQKDSVILYCFAAQDFFIPNKFGMPLGVTIGFRNFSFV
jgi:hypothetical protein